MIIQPDDFQAITTRLEKLERQNRWMKTVGGIFVMVACSALIMAWSSPRVQEVVEAEMFKVVKDGNTYAILGIAGNQPVLSFTGINDPRTSSINASYGLNRFTIYDQERGQSIRAGIRTDILGMGVGRDLFFEITDESIGSINVDFENPIGPRFKISSANELGEIIASIEENGPSIELLDGNSETKTAIGTITLVNQTTGAREIRPIASLVLFGLDGSVIWKMP